MLQSISSVFVVYRHKTLTGSPDPMHANGMDKPCTEQTGVSPGSLQLELGMPGYNQSLVRSTDPPPSPVMAEENALLDADPDVLALNQSKAPGASRLDGSPGSKMVLWKRKT